MQQAIRNYSQNDENERSLLRHAVGLVYLVDIKFSDLTTNTYSLMSI